MASSAQSVSLQDYLKSDYEPDAEYVDGLIEERPAAENDHSAWQGAICAWFGQSRHRWSIRVRPSLRVRASTTRFRVPDVTILDRAQPTEQIVTHPPLAVFEVLSPEDRMQPMLRKLEDYSKMGIPEIWVVDPETRDFSRYSARKLVRCHEFSLDSRGMHLPAVEFAVKEIEALLD